MFFFGENSVNFENLVKTWQKPGKFTKFLKNHKIKNQDTFYTSEIHQKKRFNIFLVKFIRFGGKFKKKNTKVTT